jgi:hypothetical protein
LHANLQYKDIYQYFRMGLVTGLVEKDALIAWADKVLLREPQPDFAIVELSLSGKLPYSQLVYMLNRMQGEADYGSSLNMLLACAEMRLGEHPDEASDLIMGLRLLNAEQCLPAALRGSLEDLDKLLGKYQHTQISYEVLSARLAEFLAPYAEFRDLLEEVEVKNG